MTTPGPVSLLLATVALLTMCAAALGLPARATYGAPTSGDEPYYLVTALSLAQDQSLDIDDELRDKAYTAFHPIPLDPQTAAAGGSVRLSPHDPLLAVLLAPAMAVGWPLAKMVLVFLAGLTAALTTRMAIFRFRVPPKLAGMVVGGLFVGIPLAPYGTQVYPEMPAALLVVVAVDGMLGLEAATRRQARASFGILLASLIGLPWLSVKYVPIAAVLAFGAGWCTWRSGRRRMVGWGALILIFAAAIYLIFHQVRYGGWTVYAAGDHFVDSGEFGVVGSEPDLVGRSRRVVGLLVDRSFGVGTWSPAWLAAPAAVAVLIAGGVRQRWILLAPMITGWLVASFVALTMHGWWVPGRQIVVILPLLAIAMAVAAQRVDAVRIVVLAGAAVGLINWLWLAVETSTGRRTLIVDFSQTAAPPYRLLALLMPDGLVGGPTHDLWLGGWAAVLLATAAWAVVRSRHTSDATTALDADDGRRKVRTT